MARQIMGFGLLAGLAFIVVAALASVSLLSPERSTLAAKHAGRLGVSALNRQFVARNCQKRCARVVVHSLSFEHAPTLTARLQARLLAMAPLSTDPSQTATEAPDRGFAHYAAQLFAQSAAARRRVPDIPPYSAQLDARVISTHDGLVILRLDADVYLGGAHGIPDTTYWVVDTADDQVLSLDDMLLPGRKQAFEKVLKAAHRRWRARQPLALSDWPFVASANVAPLARDLVVTYQAYEIAPYSFGEPDIHIPYDHLRGILKPRFLPAEQRQ